MKLGVLLVLFAGCTRPSGPTKWTAAKGEDKNGQPHLLRIAVGALADHTALTTRVDVIAKVDRPDEHGFPAGRELEELNAIEAALVGAVCAQGTSRLVLVDTGSAEQHWTFYTRDGVAAGARAHDVEHAYPSHKLTVSSERDEDWAAYPRM